MTHDPWEDSWLLQHHLCHLCMYEKREYLECKSTLIVSVLIYPSDYSYAQDIRVPSFRLSFPVVNLKSGLQEYLFRCAVVLHVSPLSPYTRTVPPRSHFRDPTFVRPLRHCCGSRSSIYVSLTPSFFVFDFRPLLLDLWISYLLLLSRISRRGRSLHRNWGTTLPKVVFSPVPVFYSLAPLNNTNWSSLYCHQTELYSWNGPPCY